MIAIDNGSLVAEPVNLSDAAAIEDISREHGKLPPPPADDNSKSKSKGKLGMSPIAEASHRSETGSHMDIGPSAPSPAASAADKGEAEVEVEADGVKDGNVSDAPKTTSAAAAAETLKKIAHEDEQEGRSPSSPVDGKKSFADVAHAGLAQAQAQAQGQGQGDGKKSKKQKKKEKEKAKKNAAATAAGAGASNGNGAVSVSGSGASTPSEASDEGKVKKHAGTERESLLD